MACVREEIAELRATPLFEVDVLWGQLQQAGSESALGCDSKQCRPAIHESVCRGSFQVIRLASGAGPCKLPHQVQGLCAPAPAYLEPEHSKAAPCSSAKFWVDTAPLASACCAECNTRRLCCLRSGLAISSYRADQSCVYRNLRALTNWEAIRHNLNTAVIEDWCVQVHVPQEDVGSDACSSLTANPRSRMLKRDATRA